MICYFILFDKNLTIGCVILNAITKAMMKVSTALNRNAFSVFSLNPTLMPVIMKLIVNDITKDNIRAVSMLIFVDFFIFSPFHMVISESFLFRILAFKT